MTEEEREAMRKARRVSREEREDAWLKRNSQSYTSGMYDNEDCYD